MIILHYFLGFPPYRTGGLTKFAMDLMKSQVKDGNQVIGLWPGEIRKYGGDPVLKNKGKINEINSVELINPLPVPLDEGIKEIDVFMKSCDEKIYQNFLKKIKPDVIHVHTLMGIYKEFFMAANNLGIRMIFTTHDYFGICPKVTMYKNNRCCEGRVDCRDCIQCNSNALSLKKIKILQSGIYRTMKDSFIVKKMRRKHRNQFYTIENSNNIVAEKKYKERMQEYRLLREYYIDIIQMVDCIHFNSTITEKIYKKYITPKSDKVISITHQEIGKKIVRKEKSDQFRITYLGPIKPHKGYFILKQALDELWNEGKRDFILNVFSAVENPPSYMYVKENGYKYEELEQIFAKTDVVIVPSVWYETFGFTALEAVSFGIPVIISDHVGAKDVVGSFGFIFKSGNVTSLKDTLKKCNASTIDKMRENIKNKFKVKTWPMFCKEMYDIYLENK